MKDKCHSILGSKGATLTTKLNELLNDLEILIPITHIINTDLVVWKGHITFIYQLMNDLYCL